MVNAVFVISLNNLIGHTFAFSQANRGLHCLYLTVGHLPAHFESTEKVLLIFRVQTYSLLENVCTLFVLRADPWEVLACRGRTASASSRLNKMLRSGSPHISHCPTDRPTDAKPTRFPKKNQVSFSFINHTLD